MSTEAGEPMPHSNSPSQDEHDDTVHIDLDRPEPEPDDRERRLNIRITGLLIIAVVLAMGLVTSTVLYIDQVGEANELRQQLAEAENKTETKTETNWPGTDDPFIFDSDSPLIIVPEDASDFPPPPGIECEKFGWFVLDDPSLADGRVIELNSGGEVVYCSDQPQ